VGVRGFLPGFESLEHDPEEWEPVFRKDHAQQKDEIAIRLNPTGS